MEVLRFILSGKTAIFKKPDVNSYIYFTYGNVHKVALLGMFGAILGYGGYAQMSGPVKSLKQGKLSESYPEFYKCLKDLNISILPALEYEKRMIPKKIQSYNNSTGYASNEQGGNLIVKEQWLENPKWEICVLLDCEEAIKIKDALLARKCVYPPYLGKNDHPADIKNVRVESAEKVDFSLGKVNCLVPKDMMDIAVLDYDDYDDLSDNEDMEDFFNNGGVKYVEALPYYLDSWTNNYILRTFLYTNQLVRPQGKEVCVYHLPDKKKIVFY